MSGDEGAMWEGGQVVAPRTLRIRINVSTSIKGIETPDSTVEGVGYTMEEVLEQSDALVAALRTRYPVGEKAVKEGE